jgi:hypothetical protein
VELLDPGADGRAVAVRREAAMRTPVAFALALLAGVGLAGCGQGGPSGTEPSVVGAYVIDVNRTPSVPVAGGPDASRQTEEARRTRLSTKYGADTYRLEVFADGTFRTTLAQPDGAFVFSGTWTRVPEGLRLVTTAVNGEPPAPDAQVAETAGVEEGALVLTDGGRTLYLRRL